jgi:NtrC-family two-component system sensor histidine kinase KinB
MLRNRLLLGVLSLIILLMMVSGYAVWLFVRLGGAVNTTLRENYTSIAAMRDLKESALRLDRALAFEQAGLASRDQTRAVLAAESAICRRCVQTERGIITEPGEFAAAEKLAVRDDAFLAAAASAVDNAGNSAALTPPLGELLASAAFIQSLNERAMSQKDLRARETARRSTRVMLLAMAAALPLALFFGFRLGTAVLRPIQRLTESARELGEGNLDQVLPVPSHDELGQLADAFNKMAGKLRLYRQTTTDELVHARQATEVVFAALLDPIVIFSSEGEIVYQNPAAERLRKKLAGTETVLPIVPLAMKVLRGEGDYLPESFEQSICVRVDEREKFLLPRIIGLRDGGAGAVAILHDVTRFRLLDDVKTNLVATVSHELKTPLTSIRMAVYLLLEERVGSLTPKQTELLIAAREDAERLLDLINNLLDLAKLESGAASSERRWQHPGDLVRQAVENSRDLISAAGLKIAMQVDPDLPPVSVAADQLGHVFANLISNAAKHSPPGEEVVVAARAGSGGKAVRFSVSDHGPGIPAAERKRVFEKFYRLAGESKEGAGLGLAICREIVRGHDGEIGVIPASAVRGSEFFFSLPAGDPAAASPSPS